MLVTFFKYLLISLNCFYIFNKLLNIKPNLKHNIIDVITSLFMAVITYLLKAHTPHISMIFIIMSLTVSIKLTRKVPLNITFITCIISYGLSFFFFFISSVLITFMMVFIKNASLFYTVSMPLMGILGIFLASIPFRFRRLKNGMPFLLKKSSNTLGICIGIIFVILTTFFALYDKNDTIFKICILSSGLFGIALIIWWRAQLTRLYRDHLRTTELEFLRDEVDRLKTENEKLSKIIHKDNKLIPAMEMTVRNVLNNITTNEADTARLNELQNSLSTLSAERAGVISAYENEAFSFEPTGSLRLDSLLNYMKLKMDNESINFTFTQNANVRYLVQKVCDEDSLCTLIADMLENALIATKNCDVRNIHFGLDIEDGFYALNFVDSGTAFSPEVYMNMGLQRHTTHQDTGGSGIGLMTTFEIIKKYRASFVIDEKLNNNFYTKKLTISFDRLNQVYIKSRRKEVLELSSQRLDIVIQ